MTVINQFDALEEMTYFIRNSDVLTITERSVATNTDTGTFTSDSTHLINVADIKNIRSVVVSAVTLTFGTDYTYDIDFDDSGTIKTKITFTSAQTGAYTITYDNGTDSIFPDLPKNSLSISAYPRVSIVINSETADAVGFGNQKVAIQSAYLFTIASHATRTKKVMTTNDLIKQAIMTSQNSFFYFNVTLPQNASRIALSDNTKQEIFQQSRDFISITNIEIA